MWHYKRVRSWADFIMMKSDLSTLYPANIISKYADDINLLVPQHCDDDLAAEFDNIQRWAVRNKMMINLLPRQDKGNSISSAMPPNTISLCPFNRLCCVS